MNIGQLRTRIDKHLEQHGESPWSVDADKNTFINERLLELSEKTWCVFGGTALTLTGGVYEYDLHDTTKVAEKVVHPVQVTYAGTQLKDYAGIPGPVSYAEMERAFLLSGSVGTPTRWGVRPAHYLRFNKMPGSAPSACVVYGALGHAVLTDDANTIEIPEPYHDALARWIAVRMGMMRALGAPLERLRLVEAQVMDEIRILTETIYRQSGDELPPILRVENDKGTVQD